MSWSKAGIASVVATGGLLVFSIVLDAITSAL